MGKRELKTYLECPIKTVVGYSNDTGSISLDFTSTADTTFPEETHHCKVIVNDHESIVPTNNWPGLPWDRETKGVESGETDITIKWSRTYKISRDMFYVKNQPSNLVCWAAAFTVMASFRDHEEYTINQFLNMLDNGDNTGHFDQLFNSNEKIFEDDIDAIVNYLGLKPVNITPDTTLNLSPSSFFMMLKQYGPLFTIITALPGIPSHALIIYGVEDTGGPDSHIDYIDVGEDLQYCTGLFTGFISEYSTTQGLSNQMWYFNGMENIGTTAAEGVSKGTIPLTGSYHNHIISEDGSIKDTDESCKFPLEVDLTIDIVIGPSHTSPDTVIITLKNNRFPETTAAMSLTGNDSVVNPSGG
jgi:hypothetical protein